MSDPFIGEIRLLAFEFTPRNWASCSGALLPISSNPTLFSLLSNNYGGDGRSTFALPDLRGKGAISKGRHPGSQFEWQMGQANGNETHTLTLPELANHSHIATFSAGLSNGSATLLATTDDGDSPTPSAGAYLASANPPAASGPDKPENIYKTNPTEGSKVSLGGVNGDSSGTVTIEDTGNSAPFSIMQPVLAMNYCLAMEGIYPSRS
jgi:microcystin-dependent protein